MFNFLKKKKSVIITTLIVFFVATIALSPIIITNTVYGQAPGQVPGQPIRNPFNNEVIGGPVGPPAPGECYWYDLGCYISKLFNSLVLGIAVAFLYIGSFLVGIAGSLLDHVMRYTIIEMSANVGVGGNLHDVISTTWKAFRDLANLAFIFILLYIAIRTILGDGSGQIKKLLTRVIIVALLLNFSLFFTKIVVDVSNILAVVFYNAIGTVGGGGNLGNAYMAKFGFTSWYNWGTANDIIRASTDGGAVSMLMFGFMGMVFMGIAAFIFFALSFFLIARFVTIIFLFILSPLAFAAMALPKDGYSGKWIKALTDQVIFAPAMLALLWVSLKMLDVIVRNPDPNNNILKASANLGKNASGTAATAGELFMNFFLVIAFTFGALIIAKVTGARGASGFVKFADKFKSGAQGYIGRGALRATGIATLDRKFGETEFGKSKFGRGLRSISTGALTNQSFGSGRSVQKVDKEVKKKNEEYVKAVDERVNKDFDKSLPDLRKKAIEENDKEITTTNLDIKNLEDEIATAGRGGKTPLPPALKAEKQKQITEKKKTVERLAQENSGYKQRIEYAGGKGMVATKEEKEKWLKQKQLEEAQRQEGLASSWVDGVMTKTKLKPLAKNVNDKVIKRIPVVGGFVGGVAEDIAGSVISPMSAQHKMAAKKLRESLRGGGKKDAKKLLEEVLEATGESSASDKPEEGGKK